MVNSQTNYWLSTEQMHTFGKQTNDRTRAETELEGTKQKTDG